MNIPMSFSILPNGFDGRTRGIDKSEREAIKEEFTGDVEATLDMGDVDIPLDGGVAKFAVSAAIVKIQGIMRNEFGRDWPGDDDAETWLEHVDGYNGRTFSIDELAERKGRVVDPDVVTAKAFGLTLAKYRELKPQIEKMAAKAR